LVENAVKHNVILANRPLLIEIETTKTGQLQMRNNIQRNNTGNVSNGVGLANVAAKYRTLSHTDIIIPDRDEHFTVLLPLLN
jgi:two-component system, LytTR family, sensor kinase